MIDGSSGLCLYKPSLILDDFGSGLCLHRPDLVLSFRWFRAKHGRLGLVFALGATPRQDSVLYQVVLDIGW